MGLAITYIFKACIDDKAARASVEKLCERARTLGFDVDGVDDHDLGAKGNQGAQIFTTWWEITGEGDNEIRAEFAPRRAIMFLAQAKGCEPIFMGLARYPEVVLTKAGPVKSRFGNCWGWYTCVKTQYAALPKHGGVKNFLNAHIGIVKLCDLAKELGFETEITDEGDYYQKRDEKTLVEKMVFLERAMAGLAGALKDSGLKTEAAISDHPQFERLEANGREELGDKIRDAMQIARNELRRPGTE